MKKRKKIISLNNKLNITQYDIFYKFLDPFQKEPNEFYKKLNAINNIDNNINYCIYKSKRKTRKILSEEKKTIKKSKNKSSLNSSPEKNEDNKDSHIIKKEIKQNDKEMNNINNKEEKRNNKNSLTTNKRKTNKIKKTNIFNILDYYQKLKSKNDYEKIIKGQLDKELVINKSNYNEEYNDKNNESEKYRNYFGDYELNKLDRNKNLSNKDNKIYEFIKVDNKIINHCMIKKKVVYDIKPLNKLKEKGRCHFSRELSSKNNNIIKSPSFTKESFFNIPFKDIFQNKKNGDECYFNRNINTSKNEKNNNKNENENDNVVFNTKNNYDNKSHTEYRNEGKFHSKSTSNINFGYATEQFKFNKKNEDNAIKFFNLKKLYKDIPNKRKHKKIYIYYEDGIGVTRGEKLKFLKTSFPINLIKPLESQKELKIKFFDKLERKKELIHKKFAINHYNLDIINRNNKKLIRNTTYLKKDLCKQIKNQFLLLYDSINDFVF